MVKKIRRVLIFWWNRYKGLKLDITLVSEI